MTAKSGIVKKIAAKRIEILYSLSKKAYDSDPKLSSDYVKLIKQISRHYKIRLPDEFKKGMCKKCNTVLIPGKTSSSRLVSSKGYVAIKCLNCGAEMHVHYRSQIKG